MARYMHDHEDFGQDYSFDSNSDLEGLSIDVGSSRKRKSRSKSKASKNDPNKKLEKDVKRVLLALETVLPQKGYAVSGKFVEDKDVVNREGKLEKYCAQVDFGEKCRIRFFGNGMLYLGSSHGNLSYKTEIGSVRTGIVSSGVDRLLEKLK